MRCFIQNNKTVPKSERTFLGRLFFKIAEVLKIKEDNIVCQIEFYNRETPLEPAGAFNNVETNPYLIKLANLFSEPTYWRRFEDVLGDEYIRGASMREKMGKTLAHEMIHLKQSLRDGLTAVDDDDDGYIMFRGERFTLDDIKVDPSMRHLPFEQEAYARMHEVYRNALALM